METDTSEKLRNHFENHLQKSATLRTSSQVSVQYSPTLCRKTIPNGHLQKTCKIYIFNIKTRLARSVWIRFLRACAGKWHLTDTSKKASEKACWRCLFHFPRACQEKWYFDAARGINVHDFIFPSRSYPQKDVYNTSRQIDRQTHYSPVALYT